MDSDLFQPISEVDAYTTTYVIAIYFPTFVRVYLSSVPISKLNSGLELKTKLVRSAPATSVFEETNLERSIRRTRKNISDLTYCNQFDSFNTFTFAEDRYNVEGCKKRMLNWLHNERNRKGRFKYLIVPEFHKDGALHFHALMEGYPGEVREAIHNGIPVRQNKQPVYTVPSYTAGFTNVKKLDKRVLTNTQVSFYLQKYITKDMPIIFGKNRYYRSLNLLKPKVEHKPEPWFLEVKPNDKYPTKHGYMLEFNKGSSPLVDMFLEAHWP